MTTHKWADNFLDFFCKIKKLKEGRANAGYSSFDAHELAAIATKYDDILKLAESEHEKANNPRVTRAIKLAKLRYRKY
jgi:hypothetical protein